MSANTVGMYIVNGVTHFLCGECVDSFFDNNEDDVVSSYFRDAPEGVGCQDCGNSDGDFYDDSMDGDHESALASAGWGTDEDYGYYGEGDDGW